MQKPANNNYPIHDLIRQRWSPRAFSRQPVENEKLCSLIEAARWAASGSNDQPWQFILGFNGDETWNRIFESLVEFNQLWTKDVPVLLLACANTISKKTGIISPSYEYDTGQAMANMAIQATAMGLFVHQIGGFDKKKTAQFFELHETVKPMVVIAIGYYGNATELHLNLQPLEQAERVRKNFDTFVFVNKHGNPSELF